MEFRESIDEEQASYCLKCGILGIEPGPGPGAATFAGACPYRGLQYFDIGDAAFFFGREATVDWVLNAFKESSRSGVQNRFFAIPGGFRQR